MPTEIRYGLLNGLLVCVWSLGEFLLGIHTRHMQYSAITSLLSAIIPFVILLRALQARRSDTVSGALTLWQGAKVGLVVGLVTGAVLAIYFQIYFRWINPDWLQYAEAYERQKLLAAGRSLAEIEQEIARLRKMQSPLWQSAAGILGTVLLDTLLALVITLFLSRAARRKGQLPEPENSDSEAAR